MSLDSHCKAVIVRLDEALLSRREPSAADLEHAQDCATCSEHLTTLRAAVASLAAEPTPEIRDDRVRDIRMLVAQELASDHAAIALAPRSLALPSLPPGYARELARILAWAALPLPLLLFGYAQIFQFGGALLGQLLPPIAVAAIGFAISLGMASWLAVVYGSIPFVAHQRMSAARARLQ